ncbi:MAG TPA: DUF2796 domain-containing protein [Burkholderiaceae bacterium]|nr:DUF2796 domain-containing protein [Burkholderiaceae bacterium]
MLLRVATACAALLAAPLASRAQAPHEHGVVHLDVAVDPARITIQLSSPLDNLLGFERAPRTDAERQRVAAMVATLRASSRLFAIDPAAGCKPGAVQLDSAALQLGTPDPAELQAGHADIDARFEFDCTDAGRAGFVDTTLLAGFAAIQRVAVQIASNRGQRQLTLTRPMSRIALPR